MLQIKKHTIKRKITLEEFMKLKKDEAGRPGRPHEEKTFAQMRQDAKGINFSFLFGAVASTFARRSLEVDWTEEQADSYIRDYKLRDLKDKIIARYPREEPIMWKYITCASDIRSKFFKTYPGLMTRIERERAFALEHGYVRCWHGVCRRIPELFFMSKNEKGRLNGDDEKLYGMLVGNLLNIAANTGIQNLEAVHVMPAITQLHTWLTENNMKSYIWGSVHDSIDFVIHEDEVEAVCKKMLEVCRTNIQGMPLDIEITISDLMQGEYYKGGGDWKRYIDKEKITKERAKRAIDEK